MSGSTILIMDPIGAPRISGLKLAPRPESLNGLTVGLLNHGWWSFNTVLHHFEELLKERCGVSDVIFVDSKVARIKERGGVKWDNPNSGMLEPKFIDELADKCDVFINGLGN
ncbi:MAG: hypothetical protein HYX94_11135 [Chloroflexi bacterium]|nr:hypothetical protein [Chloroflexota bacterium]